MLFGEEFKDYLVLKGIERDEIGAELVGLERLWELERVLRGS